MQKKYKPINKTHKELLKRSKVGKWHYSITDNDGTRNISMIRKMSYSVYDGTTKMKYEIFGTHGQDTHTFDTYKEAIKYIKGYYDGKLKHVHRCECGECWESN